MERRHPARAHFGTLVGTSHFSINGWLHFHPRQKRNEWFTFAMERTVTCRAVAALHAPGLIATSHRAIRARSRWRRVRGLLNRDLVVRSTSSKAATVRRSPHGAATACCLSDAVRAPAHVACCFAQWSSGKDSRAPGCPLRHDPKQLSMDLCVSSLALAASLTSQYWSNWSPGRLPDLGW